MPVTQITSERAADFPNDASSEKERYVVHVSQDSEDSEWDEFLKALSHGSHVQTSLWGQVKAWQGWRTARIVVRAGTRIVAGAQLLIRSSGLLGNIAYVPKGPVFGRSDPGLAELLVRTLHEVAVDESVKFLIVQPANGDESLAEQLPDWGFRPCPIETAPTATVIVDLSSDLDTILARMKKGMRNGIRRSQRRGIEVRAGTEDDLPTFHHLLKATSKRRGFSPFELDYFIRMWRILNPRGYMELFLSEYAKEAVSAQLVIPFGDTVVAKQIGWSGRHRQVKPNEGLDWATIKWAKLHGFTYYDLEGIEPEVARTILSNQTLPKSFVETPDHYKTRFGGDVQLYPQAYCQISNPFLRWAYDRTGSRFARSKCFQKAVSRFRTS